MDIIDFPGLNGTMRSGESIYNKKQVSDDTKCGILHRLTPFLTRIRGDATLVEKSKIGLTTSSEGGDCHMGRAFFYSQSERKTLIGKCSLKTKTKTSGQVN
ncbi:MAG: hypothetical protein ACKO96_41620, partial [Flammeovirgaceae bacterium]